MYDHNALNIYTDGSSLPTPRRGGCGIRFVFPEFLNEDEVIKDFSTVGYRGATNNQMELEACIYALNELNKCKEFKRVSRVIIYTDSMYVQDNFKTAIFVWSRNGWRTSLGKPVLNSEQWKRLIKSIQKLGKSFDIEYVKGHFGNEHNEVVDKLAKKSAKNSIEKFSKSKIIRRKISLEKTEVGSVRMEGQRISIKIIESEYLKTQKEYRFRYEVFSKRSKYYKKVDFIHSDFPLRAGHHFFVIFNKNNNYPQINKVIREIKKI